MALPERGWIEGAWELLDAGPRQPEASCPGSMALPKAVRASPWNGQAQECVGSVYRPSWMFFAGAGGEGGVWSSRRLARENGSAFICGPSQKAVYASPEDKGSGLRRGLGL